MKKMLIATLVAGLMSVSAMATDGTIARVQVKSDATVLVGVLDATNVERIQKLVGTPDAIKAMLAVSLTAKTTGAPVRYNTGTYNAIDGWASTMIQ